MDRNTLRRLGRLYEQLPAGAEALRARPHPRAHMICGASAFETAGMLGAVALSVLVLSPLNAVTCHDAICYE